MSSSSYLSICYNAVVPRWYKTEPLGKVIYDLKRVNTLDIMKYCYKMVFIPKVEGSSEMRPLGVPTVYWRVYLHAWNNILLIWLSPLIPKCQHGFFPKRGTKTAWEQIYNEVLDSPNIYEFDLRKFFDSVNLKYLTNILEVLDVPKGLIDMLMNCNRAYPKCGTKMPQSWKSDYDQALHIKYHFTNKWGLDGYWEVYYWLSRNPKNWQAGQYLGVSQGSPTSPVLSTLMLIPLLLVNPAFAKVQYADDGILYNFKDQPNLLFPPESGIKIHPDKSRMIRRDSKWLKPLKFLGQVYIPNELAPLELVDQASSDNIVKGGFMFNATRIKKDFMIEKLESFQSAIYYDYSIKGDGYSSGSKEWYNSKYHGYIQSRLYGGSWSIPIESDWNVLHYENKSWCQLEMLRPFERILNGRLETVPLDLFNVSSFACQSLLRRIEHSFKGRKMPAVY